MVLEPRFFLLCRVGPDGANTSTNAGTSTPTSAPTLPTTSPIPVAAELPHPVSPTPPTAATGDSLILAVQVPWLSTVIELRDHGFPVTFPLDTPYHRGSEVRSATEAVLRVANWSYRSNSDLHASVAKLVPESGGIIIEDDDFVTKTPLSEIPQRNVPEDAAKNPLLCTPESNCLTVRLHSEFIERQPELSASLKILRSAVAEGKSREDVISVVLGNQESNQEPEEHVLKTLDQFFVLMESMAMKEPISAAIWRSFSEEERCNAVCNEPGCSARPCPHVEQLFENEEVDPNEFTMDQSPGVLVTVLLYESW